MAAAVQLLAWTLLLVLARLPASARAQPSHSGGQARLLAAGASPRAGWVPELAGRLSLGGPFREALRPRQALPALGSVALAASGHGLLFGRAGGPEERWRGSRRAPSEHTLAPAGSSAHLPLPLGADDLLQTPEGPQAAGPAATRRPGGPGPAAATFLGLAGRGRGSCPFSSRPGSGGCSTASSGGHNPLPSGWPLRATGSSGAMGSRELHSEPPSLARAGGGLGRAGQDKPGTARTPCPRPTVAWTTQPGWRAQASRAEWQWAAAKEPGRAGHGGQLGDVPQKGTQGAGQAAPTLGPSLPWGRGLTSPTWSDALGLPPHPTDWRSRPWPEGPWLPAASPAPTPAGAGGSGARGWPGPAPAPAPAPAPLSAGQPELPAGLVLARAVPVQGSPTWGASEGAVLEARALAWTEGLLAHQRSARRVLPETSTQPPQAPGTAAPGTEQGSALPPTTPRASLAAAPHRPGAAADELGSLQQVQGAVAPRTPVNATSSARPTALGTGHAAADAARTRPPAPPRRGLVRVTTQRALQRPSEPGPSLPASGLPCPHAGDACSPLQPNRTLLRWADLQRTLSLAWPMHVYGTSALFLLLSLLCASSLLGSPGRGLPHTQGAWALLLGVGLLRASFLLADPYGTRARLPGPALRLLYNAPFPLLLSAFALLLPPPALRRLPLLAALASLHSALLLATDLLVAPLSPRLGMGLHLLSCACGAALLLAPLLASWQLRRAQHGAPRLGPNAGVLVGCSVPGLLCCGLQAYGALWLGGALGPPGEFSWPWWFVQLWFRIGELLLAFALCFVASRPVCQPHGTASHSCWAKLRRYLCAQPHGTYAWAPGGAERPAGRSHQHLQAPKDSSEPEAPSARDSPSASPTRPPACACSQASAPSLSELEFRPPSPINLSRSIDAALCREHLLRDSLFSHCSLARQDSCSSLGQGTALPPGARLRRCGSLGELPPAEGTISGSSLGSFSRGSLTLSWNPWRHGHASLESLPLEELPGQAPLLPPQGPAVPAGDCTGDARRRFLALSKQADSRSLSSDTIEL
ncbi:proline-rich transmembrane protein 3 [Carettochelys insculpta]|uniref:proline-rich transmembrane protein 3 n=1 Tax=Carettochelys insculpta TaxID=44489 RepID=UPI003EBACFF5